MKITETQMDKLLWLSEAGGSGYLDRYGRMIAGGKVGQQGWQQAWLNLVANGYIAGVNERLFITDAGKQMLPPNVELNGEQSESARTKEMPSLYTENE